MSAMEMKNYQLIGSYGKYYSLDAPIFSGSQPKLPVLEEEDPPVMGKLISLPNVDHLTFSSTRFCLERPDGVELDSLQRLSALLKYSAGIIRIDPLNKYLLHKAIPSARSCFLSRLSVALFQTDEWRIYRYNAEHHMLVLDSIATVDMELAADLPEGINAAILLSTDVSKILSSYGDFSPYLAMLEAGHCTAMIRILANAVEVEQFDLKLGPAAVDIFPNVAMWKDASALITRKVFYLRVELDNPQKYEQEFVCPNGNIRVNAQQNDSEASPSRYRFLRSMCRDLPGHSVPLEKMPDQSKKIVAPPGFDLCRAIRQRSSGPYRSFLSGTSAMDSGRLERMLATGHCRMSRVKLAPSLEKQFVIYILALRINGLRQGVYKVVTNHGWQLEPVKEQEIADTVQNALDPDYAWLDTGSVPFVALFASDIHELMSEPGVTNFERIQETAGILSQVMSLALADIDYFSRPIKSGSELLLETLLENNMHINYALVSGQRRHDDFCLNF